MSRYLLPVVLLVWAVSIAAFHTATLAVWLPVVVLAAVWQAAMHVERYRR